MKYRLVMLRAVIDAIVCLCIRIKEFVLMRTFKGHLSVWMQPEEVLIIKEILRGQKPHLCLEWGSGGSTLLFPRMLQADAKWISVEHNPLWAKQIIALASKIQNLAIHLIPPNRLPWSDQFQDGASKDLEDYVNFPLSLELNFDFILVDGRARVACLEKALTLVKPEGIVVLHDAGRQHYHGALRAYYRGVRFRNIWPEGGLWIGSPSGNLEKLDIEKNKLVWAILHHVYMFVLRTPFGYLLGAPPES